MASLKTIHVWDVALGQSAACSTVMFVLIVFWGRDPGWGVTMGWVGGWLQRFED